MVVSVHHKQPTAWYILPILSLQRDTYALMQDCPCHNQFSRSCLLRLFFEECIENNRIKNQCHDWKKRHSDSYGLSVFLLNVSAFQSPYLSAPQ